jgi:hypothetical protein
MNGILGVLPPGLRGYVAGEQMQNQRGVNQLQQMHGILGLQGMLEQRAMEQQIAPLKMKLLQAQVQGVENPAPTKIDGGGEWLFIDKTGNVVGRIPKTASPDTVAKESGADRRHGQVSGNTAATIGNQQYLHGIPSASSLLGAQVSLAGMNRPVLNETLGGWLTPPPVGVPGIGAPRLPQAPQGQMPSAMDSTPRISPNMMVSPQDQARRDAEAARIRAAESNGGAGFVPTSSAIPGFTPVPGLGPKPEKPTAESLKQTTGVENLRNAIETYKTDLKGFGALDVLNPAARARIGTSYNNMLLQAKEAYNLGVLNGPDYAILQEVITNPASAVGAITPKKALNDQLDQLDKIMSGVGKTVQAVQSDRGRGTYRGPERRVPTVGMVVDGFRFKGGDPSKKENWEKQ